MSIFVITESDEARIKRLSDLCYLNGIMADDPEAKVVKVDDEVGVSEVMIGTGEGPSGTSIRRADSQGHSAGVDQRGTQLLEAISGLTVKNEEGTPETCQILMEKLNELGESWDSLQMADKKREDGVDCRLRSSGNEKKILEIQVTKAEREIWGALALHPEGVDRTREIETVCDSLLIAIKEKIEKYPNKDKACLVLALEAVHYLVTKDVSDRFIEKYTQAARSGGFKQVWLVGPTPALTFQLA